MMNRLLRGIGTNINQIARVANINHATPSASLLTDMYQDVQTLHHSVSLPRPYSRNGRVQGTKGIWLEDVNGVYIEGMSRDEVKIDPAGNPYDNHYWDKVEDYYEKYDHPIWKEYKDNLLGGHGGLDSLVIRAFLDAVRNRENTPIDVYDVAAWMAVTCLSEQSIALGSMPIAFPDFTNGKWIRREPAPKNRWSLDEIHAESLNEQKS